MESRQSLSRDPFMGKPMSSNSDCEFSEQGASEVSIFDGTGIFDNANPILHLVPSTLSFIPKPESETVRPLPIVLPVSQPKKVQHQTANIKIVLPVTPVVNIQPKPPLQAKPYVVIQKSGTLGVQTTGCVVNTGCVRYNASQQFGPDLSSNYLSPQSSFIGEKPKPKRKRVRISKTYEKDSPEYSEQRKKNNDSVQRSRKKKAAYYNRIEEELEIKNEDCKQLNEENKFLRKFTREFEQDHERLKDENLRLRAILDSYHIQY